MLQRGLLEVDFGDEIGVDRLQCIHRHEFATDFGADEAPGHVVLPLHSRIFPRGPGAVLCHGSGGEGCDDGDIAPTTDTAGPHADGGVRDEEAVRLVTQMEEAIGAHEPRTVGAVLLARKHDLVAILLAEHFAHVVQVGGFGDLHNPRRAESSTGCRVVSEEAAEGALVLREVGEGVRIH